MSLPLTEALEELIALGVEGPALIAAIRRLEQAIYGQHIVSLREAVAGAAADQDARLVARAAQRDDRVWVYVMGVDHPGEGHPVKVGISQHPNHRLRTLERERRANLYVAHTEGPFERWRALAIERATHQRLAPHRHEGEWFLCSVEDAIEEVRAVSGALV